MLAQEVGSANVARFLPERARQAPQRAAVIDARDQRITFAGLESRSNAIAHALATRGVERGMRVSLFVRPGIELIAITYALFKLGAVPVLIDPGMGRKALLTCIERMRPEVLIGVPRAHLARLLFPRAFATVKLAISVGARLPRTHVSLKTLLRTAVDTPICANADADTPAAILFTSGSTGPPKGVLYTHGMFDAQVRNLLQLYAFEEGEVDLACLPLFALFNIAFGITSVFPDMDPSRPASCDPASVVASIERHGVTTTFGSPAIWQRVAPWCKANGRTLGGLRRVLIAGAPVQPSLIAALRPLLASGGDVHTPYGATEGLPVSSVSGAEIVDELRPKIEYGAGTCVGRVAPEIDLRMIRIDDGPIATWNDELEVPEGEIGEVCVRGPVVTQVYAQAPEQTTLAKIASSEPDSPCWHRMGDLGRIDPEGRLWLHGRKGHRLQTKRGLRTPIPVENVLNVHPRVLRTALVGIGAAGHEKAALVVEPIAGEFPANDVETDRFIAELVSIARKSPVTSDLETFLFHRGFPVDVRHNAKIHRGELKTWAEKALA
ncbi:MAG: acyl-CoA synthetase (AMP-forming)/AMP-acid ligase II [Chlamydiales bacterium]|jgi:acyl-CoA synthetase (AMP-forming)/AMP-acid ligase II